LRDFYEAELQYLSHPTYLAHVEVLAAIEEYLQEINSELALRPQ
jgi:hypothetical protein